MKIQILTTFLKRMHPILMVLITGLIVMTACSPRVIYGVPSDFYVMMDVHNANSDGAQNINIRIWANGKVEYDVYSTGGVIRYDENDIVTFDENQILQDGKFKLTDAELTTVWDAFNKHRFFELDPTYQMAIGHSYAFILVEADGKKHMVDNIGMQVPEMRALVETVDVMLPEGVDLEYGEGYIP